MFTAQMGRGKIQWGAFTYFLRSQVDPEKCIYSNTKLSVVTYNNTYIRTKLNTGT